MPVLARAGAAVACPTLDVPDRQGPPGRSDGCTSDGSPRGASLSEVRAPRTSEALREEELARARRERELAREAELPAEERAAQRRADKAAYLADKLGEQVEAER